MTFPGPFVDSGERKRLESALGVAELRLTEVGSTEDVPNGTLLRNARSFNPGTIPALALKATLYPSQEPNQAHKAQFKNAKSDTYLPIRPQHIFRFSYASYGNLNMY